MTFRMRAEEKKDLVVRVNVGKKEESGSSWASLQDRSPHRFDIYFEGES